MQNFVFLESAMTWLARGVSPIPIKSGTKIAACGWREYQDEQPSASQVRAWFGNGHGYNLGVIGGGRHNLSILDFDELARYIAWRQAHRDLAQTFTVKTARGRHCYFWLDAPATTQYLDGVELRSRGAYVLCPPSVHPSGAIYQALDERAEIVRTSLAAILDGAKPCIEEMTGNGARVVNKPNTRLSALQDRDDLIGEICKRLPILNLVSRYTTPIASSNDGRWFIARCVFPQNHAHGDKNPSMWIDTARNKCGCFAPRCKAQNRTMDAIDLYAALHRLSNRDAIAALADELELCSFAAIELDAALVASEV